MLQVYANLIIGVHYWFFSVEKFRGNVVFWVRLIVEGVEGSDKNSGNDKDGNFFSKIKPKLLI